MPQDVLFVILLTEKCSFRVYIVRNSFLNDNDFIRQNNIAKFTNKRIRSNFGLRFGKFKTNSDIVFCKTFICGINL